MFTQSQITRKWLAFKTIVILSIIPAVVPTHAEIINKAPFCFWFWLRLQPQPSCFLYDLNENAISQKSWHLAQIVSFISSFSSPPVLFSSVGGAHSGVLNALGPEVSWSEVCMMVLECCLLNTHPLDYRNTQLSLALPFSHRQDAVFNFPCISSLTSRTDAVLKYHTVHKFSRKMTSFPFVMLIMTAEVLEALYLKSVFAIYSSSLLV